MDLTNNKPNDLRVPRDLLVRINNLHTTGNDIDVELAEIRAILAQPADQQGEPVAITELRHIFDSNRGADGTLVISKKLAAQLLADQPATAKVVLPERTTDTQSCSDVAKRIGLYGSVSVWQLGEIWNACLDEVAKLNTPQ